MYVPILFYFWYSVYNPREVQMTIMATQGRNDARSTTMLLASTASECIDDPTKALAHEDTLNNVYRLLEAYRVNKFFGLEPVPSYHHAVESLSSVPQPEQHVGEIREILECAMATVFSNEPKDEAISSITGVLKQVAYPEFGVPSDADKTKATRFFLEVVQGLRSR